MLRQDKEKLLIGKDVGRLTNIYIDLNKDKKYVIYLVKDIGIKMSFFFMSKNPKITLLSKFKSKVVKILNVKSIKFSRIPYIHSHKFD